MPYSGQPLWPLHKIDVISLIKLLLYIYRHSHSFTQHITDSIALLAVVQYEIMPAFSFKWNLFEACQGLNFISTKIEILSNLYHFGASKHGISSHTVISVICLIIKFYQSQILASDWSEKHNSGMKSSCLGPWVTAHFLSEISRSPEVLLAIH